MTRLTVAICTYNRAGYLRRTLASLAGQLPEGTRLIVVDNASTDETAAVVAEFAGAEFHRNPANLGMVGNWNRAIELMDSEYGAVFHDDDEYEPGALPRLLETLEAAPEASFVHCGVTLIDDAGAVIGLPPLDHPALAPGVEVARRIARTGPCWFFAPTVIFRLSAIRRAGLFASGLKLACDLDMWGRLALQGDVAYVPERLLRYRVHSSGGTAGETVVTQAQECRTVQLSIATMLAARSGRARPSAYDVFRAETRYLGRLALAIAVRHATREPGDAQTLSELRRVGDTGTLVERAWASLLLCAPVRLTLGAIGAIARAVRTAATPSLARRAEQPRR